MRRKVSFLVELDGSLWIVLNWLNLVEKPKSERPDKLVLRRLKDSDVKQDPAGIEFEDFDRLTVKLQRRAKEARLRSRAQKRGNTAKGARDAGDI